MNQIQNSKPIDDLEERTFQFAKQVRIFVKTLPNTLANVEDSKQLIKAYRSVGANYREADEALSKKDFFNEYKNKPKASEGKCLLAQIDKRDKSFEK